MKLLTLNCHSWMEESQLEKIKYLAEVIKEKQYDVIALQEVSQSIEESIVSGIIKEDNFVYLLNKELEKLGEFKYRYLWDFSHIGYDIYEEGLSILTRHEVEDVESFYITKSSEKTFYKSRKIIKCTISIDNKKVNFFSCHLGWWNDEAEHFKYQADNLIEKINGLSFIMGDFNNDARIRNQGYDYLLSKGLIDTYGIALEKDNGITVEGEIAGWEGKKENKRLDIIFANKNVNVKRSNVIFNNENKRVISDHYGVEVEIDIM
ncbi:MULTISPECIES: endonuclease/exonuclease/phosphatase family protein [unclassified Clostridium]|uniref:endonuclease/exonuclease/phosphatase family protein n=1 Tax=unclassified Clostridium TaxID=2614128 RepID=UPI001899E1A0|nr:MULTISPECIES: endonuclease/exonuclease/phosphatase family protein [unclassified Clostridium]MCR1952947.1 endonuclease/exonuclease/phosphatase family protein [Clostridium sp. DSM 100503]